MRDDPHEAKAQRAKGQERRDDGRQDHQEQSHRSNEHEEHLYSRSNTLTPSDRRYGPGENQERGAVRIYLEGDKGLKSRFGGTLVGNVGKSPGGAVADVHSPDSGAIRSSNRNPARQ